MPETLRREVKIRRGCGYRKVGGLYLVTDAGEMAQCGILPQEIRVCPCCGGGVKQKIGFQWVQTRMLQLTRQRLNACHLCGGQRDGCMMDYLFRHPMMKIGLIWIGAGYYPEPDEFIEEAQAMGMSRRVHSVPKGFRVGEDWTLLAHPQACAPRIDEECFQCNGSGQVTHPKIARQMEVNITEQQPDAIAATLGVERYVLCRACAEKRPGYFALVRPARIEQIVTETQAQDAEFIESLRKRNIEPVVVPDDDPDHQGRVAPRRRRSEET